MGTRKAILALRTIVQKRIRKEKETFIDIKKTFNHVRWMIIFNLIKRVAIKQAGHRLL